ncbi:MAG: transcriptional repressor LexA [Gammaproteobacteria bacterium]|nr:transcriptional repressor LexA [Gammaproteobacteria bacterium]MCF6259540.1 transcriptional repressor LexA [Gammaproteobacteria bacterium]
MKGLTNRQQEVLEMIRDFIEEYNMPPTRVEIADAMGFRSANAAEDHLKALLNKGAIEMYAGSSRGIRIVDNKEQGLPVIGRVAAGNPILAEENIEEHYQMDAAIFYPAADYLLRVKGMSMRDVGILNGDLLAVHRTQDVRSGQIVVARLGDEVTVKRFRRRGNKVRLMPENPSFKPIEVDLRDEDLTIEGLAVGVIRGEVK